MSCEVNFNLSNLKAIKVNLTKLFFNQAYFTKLLSFPIVNISLFSLAAERSSILTSNSKSVNSKIILLKIRFYITILLGEIRI